MDRNQSQINDFLAQTRRERRSQWKLARFRVPSRKNYSIISQSSPLQKENDNDDCHGETTLPCKDFGGGDCNQWGLASPTSSTCCRDGHNNSNNYSKTNHSMLERQRECQYDNDWSEPPTSIVGITIFLL